VQERIDKMTEAFRQQLAALYAWSNGEPGDNEPTAMQIEDRIREWIRQIGADTQTLLLGEMDRNRYKGKRPCPVCGEEIYWKDYESRQYITSLGEMQIERAYYHHGACHCGWVPLDERLGLGASELSPFVQEMVSYLGGFMPFGQAQVYLEKYQGIYISHDAVNDTTILVGQGLREKQEDEIQQAWEKSELPDCEVGTPPQRLYVPMASTIYYQMAREKSSKSLRFMKPRNGATRRGKSRFMRWTLTMSWPQTRKLWPVPPIWKP
jgi:hypothetical protein